MKLPFFVGSWILVISYGPSSYFIQWPKAAWWVNGFSLEEKSFFLVMTSSIWWWWFSHSVMSSSCDPMDYIACQAPLSMVFFRQEYYSGLSFPSGYLLYPGIKPESPALQTDSLPTELWGKPYSIYISPIIQNYLEMRHFWTGPLNGFL